MSSYKVFYTCNRIGVVMFIVLASSAVVRGFEPWSRQTIDIEIGICCFSVRHTSLRSKNKDLLARNEMCPNGEICLPVDCSIVAF